MRTPAAGTGHHGRHDDQSEQHGRDAKDRGDRQTEDPPGRVAYQISRRRRGHVPVTVAWTNFIRVWLGPVLDGAPVA